MNEIVVVTGSSGLIGSRVITSAPKGFTLVGFDNHGPPEPPVQAECVPVDLTSPVSVARGFERVRYAYGTRIASVVHLAAHYDFSGDESPLYDELTVGGTKSLLATMREKGFEAGQFLFSSTMLVHAPCKPGQRIDEDWPLDPRWAYPESKVKAERTIEENRGVVPAVVLRIAGVYDDGCHSIPLANQIQRIHERRITSHVFPGDASHGQSFVHLDDVASAIWLSIERRRQLPPSATMLVGEPETLSYDELQRTFARLLHGQGQGEEPWETRAIPKTVAEIGAWIQDHMPLAEEPFIKPWMIGLADDHYEVDVSRARALLGWSPTRSLRATLPAMIAAFRADPEKWYEANGLVRPRGRRSRAAARS